MSDSAIDCYEVGSGAGHDDAFRVCRIKIDSDVMLVVMLVDYCYCFLYSC